MKKVFYAGTHRCRAPGQTLELIKPLLSDYGITRLADITGLDVLSVPVVMAVRPLAATLSVSQGKGISLTTAKVSAAMEAIELFHAEAAVPLPVASASISEIGPEYAPDKIGGRASRLLTRHTVLDWIEARTLLSNRRVLVPRDLVHLGRSVRAAGRLRVVTASSNGLASGNTRSEAITHGLLELMERDAVARASSIGTRSCPWIDTGTIPAGWCSDLVTRVKSAGAWLEVASIPNRFGVHCFAAYVWMEDAPMSIAGGAGAHSDPFIALSRAVTEAAQSRLTAIAGTRDDLDQHLYSRPEAPPVRPERSRNRVRWDDVSREASWSCPTDDEEAIMAAQRICAATAAEPMIVDLCHRPEFAVVKVLCPGLDFAGRDVPAPDLEFA